MSITPVYETRNPDDTTSLWLIDAVLTESFDEWFP
jgi:hypothetical protein